MMSPDWCWLLKAYTTVIKKLSMPCVVPCVGVTSILEEGSLSRGSQCDKIVKDFVNAVLEKSSMIGVRGESTAQYLTYLGFTQDRHFVVLGCPSMYAYGESLPLITPPQSLSKCGLSLNQRADMEQWRYIDQIANLFEKKSFISQYYPEFYSLMLGNPRIVKWNIEGHKEYYNFIEKYASNNEMRFFLNLKPWMECLSNLDFFCRT